MARYLPASYEPIPDALLWSKADLIDAVRRIARNQNWIWANHGNVVAAFGREPDGSAGPPSVTTGAWDAAYFACPNRSATGSDSVRCCGYVTVVTGSANAKVRLYQLLPGESTPTADTPYDETSLATAGTDVFFDFTARVRSGADPLRFCLRLVGASSGTYTLLSATVTWARNPSSVLGETVAAWEAISQSYVQPDRPLDAALLRALSNRTLKLVAENPRPIFAHSFIWPRISTAAAGAETRVALYSAKHDELTTAVLGCHGLWIVTGQAAVATARLYVNGVLKQTIVSAPTVLVNGVWVKDFGLGFGTPAVPSGDLKIEITLQCTTGATAPPTYCTNVGAFPMYLTIFQTTRGASALGLPGADTVPAAYQPLDDNACAPGRSVVAQDDRLGRRAGPYYLVKNLIWLAANRTAHVLIADWLHRTQVAGFDQMGTGVAGDGYYRNQTTQADRVQTAPTSWFEEAPNSRDFIPWADRNSPTIPWRISDAGHHFVGDVLGRFYCLPMNGGQIGAILRPDVLYPPVDLSGASGVPANYGSHDDCDLEFYFGATLDHRVPASRRGLAGGFRSAGRGSVKPSAGTTLSLRANTGTFGNLQALGRVEGLIAALHSAYIYEAPLTQGDLDALP